jgi:hypothetical protein
MLSDSPATVQRDASRTVPIAPKKAARAARFLAERWPAEGGRHAACLALAGLLAREHVSREDAEEVVRLLAEAADDEQAEQRPAAVESTYAKADAGEPVTGRSELEKLLGADGRETVREFRRLAGLTPTVKSLARWKGISPEVLTEAGAYDLPNGGVALPYRREDGSTPGVRFRYSHSRDQSYWRKGDRALPYGLWRAGADMERCGFAVLVEGESDSWTGWHLGLPTLGLPGAGTAGKLDTADLANAKDVYVVREPDEAGAQFVAGVARAMQRMGRTDSPKVVDLAPHKDLSELFLADPKRAARHFERARANAAPYAPPQMPYPGDFLVPNPGTESGRRFGVSIPCSALSAVDPERQWLWRPYVARETITLLSALWKAGKTTMLSRLLRRLERGGTFCGGEVSPAKVLYITEESQGQWAERRDLLGLGDWLRFRVRPFLAKPSHADWLAFLADLIAEQKTDPADVIVFDTITNLWPVRNENDAGEVSTACMPLRALSPAAVVLVHHLTKFDGKQATASRGSGALTAFVDTIVELRRYDPDSSTDRKRVLTCSGRSAEAMCEQVVELTADGTEYAAHGDKQQVKTADLTRTIQNILPPEEKDALDYTAIRKEWPEEGEPRKKTVMAALRGGVGRTWKQTGRGVKGDPERYWCPESLRLPAQEDVLAFPSPHPGPHPAAGPDSVPESPPRGQKRVPNPENRSKPRRNKDLIPFPSGTESGRGTESAGPGEPPADGENFIDL